MGIEEYTGLPASIEQREEEWQAKPEWEKNLIAACLFLGIFGVPLICGWLLDLTIGR